MDLGLDHHTAAELACGIRRLIHGERGLAPRHWYPVAGQYGLRLIFVNFHLSGTGNPCLCYPQGKSRNTHYIMSLLPYLHRVAAREHLSAEAALDAMGLILEGDATTAQITAFLVALHMKGESAAELLGFAKAMRARVERVVCNLNGEPLVDTCGTGGGGPCTFNISTVAAFVTAGTGVRVAKHGNRSISSACGSAEVFEGLGVNIHLSPELIAEAIQRAGIGFLYAPALHPAMKYAQPARLELKMQTVFNLLGPLANPAAARCQLIGASSERAAELMARALAGLDTAHSFVVHGLDGLDEVSTTAPTIVYEIRGTDLRKHLWNPADFGIAHATLADLAGGGREANCNIARTILGGEKGPRRDIVLVNSAVALMATGRVGDLRSGVACAAEAIDSGAANERLASLVRFTAQAASA
jgi:anthranilate phosphoribosyltransferase